MRAIKCDLCHWISNLRYLLWKNFTFVYLSLVSQNSLCVGRGRNVMFVARPCREHQKQLKTPIGLSNITCNTLGGKAFPEHYLLHGHLTSAFIRTWGKVTTESWCIRRLLGSKMKNQKVKLLLYMWGNFYLSCTDWLPFWLLLCYWSLNHQASSEHTKCLPRLHSWCDCQMCWVIDDCSRSFCKLALYPGW